MGALLRRALPSLLVLLPIACVTVEKAEDLSDVGTADTEVTEAPDVSTDSPPPPDSSSDSESTPAGCSTDLDCQTSPGPGACLAWRCHENGSCAIDYEPPGTPCDDGNPCTSADSCDGAGICSAPWACDDGDPCTSDVCTAAGCLYPRDVASSACEPPIPDEDGDGITDPSDPCPELAGSGQVDSDGDGLGDACDLCPEDADQACASQMLLWLPLDGEASDHSPLKGLVEWDSPSYVPDGRYGQAGLPGKATATLLVHPESESWNEITLFSAGLWVYVESKTETRELLAVKPAIELRLDAGKASCAVELQSGDSVVIGARIGVDAPGWHHLACVRRPGDEVGPARLLVVVDGVVMGGVPDPKPGAPLENPDIILVGDPSQPGAGGPLDDVRIRGSGYTPNADTDGDGVPDAMDRCPHVFDPGQMDSDDDWVGDACQSLAGRLCGPASPCPALSPCVAGTCTDGLCTWAPVEGVCDDQDPDTEDDLCESGTCVGALSMLHVSGPSSVTLSAGLHRYSGVHVATESELVCLGDTGPYYGRGCTIMAEWVQVDGAISADGQGFEPGDGPGAPCGCSAQGAGHGGIGGGGSPACGGQYGDGQYPLALGSGAGTQDDTSCVGPRGGGAIALHVSGLASLKGSLSARSGPVAGEPPVAGSSGGSILVTAGVLTDCGELEARGGAGSASSGGGGRVAVYAATTYGDCNLIMVGSGTGPLPGAPGSTVEAALSSLP